MTTGRLWALSLATGAWLLLSGVVGYLVLEVGPACDTSWDDYGPLGTGAQAICGGDFPFTPTFLTFVTVTFVGLATLILRWDTTNARPWRLCASVAALPVLAFAVLRGISLIP